MYDRDSDCVDVPVFTLSLKTSFRACGLLINGLEIGARMNDALRCCEKMARYQGTLVITLPTYRVVMDRASKSRVFGFGSGIE